MVSLRFSFHFVLFSLYDKNYTSPMTVWYQKCNTSITQIKWCLLYFDDNENPSADDQSKKVVATDDQHRFAARICEFFAIDQSEDF